MTKRQLPRPYQPKPNPSSSKGATENWEWRMAENTTRVVVELSTWPYGAPWDSYEIHAEPAAAFRRVKDHLAFGRASARAALQPQPHRPDQIQH